MVKSIDFFLPVGLQLGGAVVQICTCELIIISSSCWCGDVVEYLVPVHSKEHLGVKNPEENMLICKSALGTTIQETLA